MKELKSLFFKAIKSAIRWSDIYSELIKYNSEKKNVSGRLFELVCKYYYLFEPTVRQEYKNVWLFSEIPSKIKEKLNLGKIDHGADLVLEDHMGFFTVVQCKFRSNQNSLITWTKDKISNLFAEGLKAEYLVIFTNASGIDKHSENKRPGQLKVVTLADLSKLSMLTILEIRNSILNISKKLENFKKPKEHQLIAIKEITNGFRKHDRGQLIFPCGAGKTLVSLWVQEALKVNHTIVLLPSLALLKQTKNEWSSNQSLFVQYMCVCSAKDVDSKEDVFITTVNEISGKVSTDPREIYTFLKKNKKTIIYSTYQSLHAVCEAIKDMEFEFDLAICDEAHKTSGGEIGKFCLIHSNENIPIKKRLYMTATPRIISDETKKSLKKDNINYFYDMSNENIFGPEFYRMSFKEAIDKKILVDYQIVAVGVSSKELESAIRDRKYCSHNETIDEIANNYALEKFMKKYETNHVITFHSSIKKAEAFSRRHQEAYPKVNTYHINGGINTNARDTIISEFLDSSKSIISNARCLTEGVDLPAVDVVYFCDPKSSKIDIIQASGRALRRADHKGKKFGYIVVPIFHREQEKLEEKIDSSPFKSHVAVIRSMCSHDERLVAEIKKLKCGEGKQLTKTDNVLISETCKIIILDDFHEKLKEAIFDQIINKIRIPWKRFEEARVFVRSLNLTNQTVWKDYCKNGNKPEDIPSWPNEVYEKQGWISWGDWLGTKTIASQNRTYRSFKEVRAFVHTLNLKNRSEWQSYCRNGDKPEDVPSCPEHVYEDQGWVSMGDWLGTGKIANQNRMYCLFNKARAFVHNLSLKTQKDWKDYCQRGNKPEDIPSNPYGTYKDQGWISWGDWLGTGKIATQNKRFRSFKKARSFVRTLNLKNQTAWRDYCQEGNKPEDIPFSPDHLYKDQGWLFWGDWLDTPRRRNRIYRSFKEAKTFVHTLNLKSRSEWQSYCRNGDKPEDIPAADPSRFYKNKGWISWGDWLGTGTIASQNRTYRSFKEARAFVHALNLKSRSEWQSYCRNGDKPEDIPSNPYRTYKDQGWVSMGDWLDTGIIANQNRIFRPFIEARDFVRDLKLKNQTVWKDYYQNGNKPEDIPSNPYRVYKDAGWISWRDWLGVVSNREKISFT